jgi:hypothetical protein
MFSSAGNTAQGFIFKPGDTIYKRPQIATKSS